MKIAIVTAELPYPSNSGGRIYTWNRIKELSNLGHEIVLYSFKEKDEIIEKNKIYKYCSEINIYDRNKSFMNAIKNIFKPYSAITRFNNNLRDDLENREDIDVIIIDMPQLLYNLPKIKKVPIVLTQHNIEYKTFQNIATKSNNFIKKIIFNLEAIRLFRLESKIYNGDLIDLFTFISLNDMEFFDNRFKNKNSILIPFGYNCVKKIKTNNTTKNIVFTGKMDYQPNKEAVMWFVDKIWPIIKKEVDNVKFYIVGKNPPSEICELANKDLVVTGMVNSVEEYIDIADVIVIPLLSGGGVKIKLIEALGRENIVISTNKGIEGTIFKNKKHLLVEDDSVKFATKCIQVLNNIEEHRYLAKNAQKVIEEEYSWKSISKRYEANLYNLIK